MNLFWNIMCAWLFLTLFVVAIIAAYSSNKKFKEDYKEESK